MIDYQVARSSRKSISVHVKKDGSVKVYAPVGADDLKIQSVVTQHSKWIQDKLTKVRLFHAPPVVHEFVNGEGFLYLGKSYRLRLVPEAIAPVQLKGFLYVLIEPGVDVSGLIINWYKQQAKEVFSRRVQWLTLKFGYPGLKVNLSDAVTRWGSMGKRGIINLSWRLIMSPVPVIDYVIIHELAHLKVSSHTRDFWLHVKSLMPDYLVHKDWLEQNGHLLSL